MSLEGKATSFEATHGADVALLDCCDLKGFSLDGNTLHGRQTGLEEKLSFLFVK